MLSGVAILQMGYRRLSELAQGQVTTGDKLWLPQGLLHPCPGGGHQHSSPGSRKPEMKTGSRWCGEVSIKQASQLTFFFFFTVRILQCPGENTTWMGLLNICQDPIKCLLRCICPHVRERHSNSHSHLQHCSLTLRHSNKWLKSRATQPNKPSPQPFSKLPKGTPKLAPPIMPPGPRAGQKFRKNIQCPDK